MVDMDTQTAARTYYDAMMDVRNGRTTPDEMRATIRSLRTELSERDYTLAKLAAFNMDDKVNR